MSTRSPIPHSFFSSCAMNFVVFLMNFPYFACFTFRSTATTMDLFILLLTTNPVFSFLRARVIVFSMYYRFVPPGISLLFFCVCSFCQFRFKPCNAPAYYPYLKRVFNSRDRMIHFHLVQQVAFLDQARPDFFR